jgi:hypothetical protein
MARCLGRYPLQVRLTASEPRHFLYVYVTNLISPRVSPSEAQTKKCGHCIRQEFERNNAKTLCVEQLSGHNKAAMQRERRTKQTREEPSRQAVCRKV